MRKLPRVITKSDVSPLLDHRRISELDALRCYLYRAKSSTSPTTGVQIYREYLVITDRVLIFKHFYLTPTAIEIPLEYLRKVSHQLYVYFRVLI